MDGSRALNYLLAMFLILNICLGIGNYQKNIGAYQLEDERIEYIMDFLAEQNVSINTTLPKSFQPIQEIEVTPIEYGTVERDMLVEKVFGSDRENVVITQISDEGPYENDVRVYQQNEQTLAFKINEVVFSDNAIEINEASELTEKQALKYAELFNERIGFGKNGKKLKITYRNESFGASVTYYEVYNGLPIFGNYLRMEISDGGVFRGTMQKSEVGAKEVSKQPIYAVDQALFKLFSIIERTDRELIIEDIDLGYSRGQLTERHLLKEDAIPMYKILIEGISEPIYVNAYTNKVK